MYSALPEEQISVSMESRPNTSSSLNFRDLLLRAQNDDGGWGFHPGADSRVEPTCWVLKALTAQGTAESLEETPVASGLRFLTAAQLPDGSWPSTTKQATGCWVTSLACLVLRDTSDEKYRSAIASGLRWLCGDWPKDSSWWRRALWRFSRSGQHLNHDDHARGWGWTPGTSSWVEPTALALLALEGHDVDVLPNSTKKRRKLGEALLYDRMCPGGGWNSGNPEVYGVPGDPLVIPTSWALLALRAYPERRENKDSLAWLERVFSSSSGPGSFALAQLCLKVYNHKAPVVASPNDYYARSELLRSIPVAAWMTLAFCDGHKWLKED
jgi:Prenyltransferase and squalene oxidase repeat